MADTIESKTIAIGMAQGTNDLASIGIHNLSFQALPFWYKYDETQDTLTIDNFSQKMNDISQKNKKMYESINYKFLCDNLTLTKNELNFLFRQSQWWLR